MSFINVALTAYAYVSAFLPPPAHRLLASRRLESLWTCRSRMGSRCLCSAYPSAVFVSVGAWNGFLHPPLCLARPDYPPSTRQLCSFAPSPCCSTRSSYAVLPRNAEVLGFRTFRDCLPVSMLVIGGKGSGRKADGGILRVAWHSLEDRQP